MICAITMEQADDTWFWHCRTCDTQGDPADIISAYWGALVHEEAERGADDTGA